MLGMLTFRHCPLSKPVSPEKTVRPTVNRRRTDGKFTKIIPFTATETLRSPGILPESNTNSMPERSETGHFPRSRITGTSYPIAPQRGAPRPSCRMRRDVPTSAAESLSNEATDSRNAVSRSSATSTAPRKATRSPVTDRLGTVRRNGIPLAVAADLPFPPQPLRHSPAFRALFFYRNSP